MHIYHKDVQLLDYSHHEIIFAIKETEQVFHVDLNSIGYERPVSIGKAAVEDQLLIREESADCILLIYSKSEIILALLIHHIPKLDFCPTETSYEMNFEYFTDLIEFRQTGEISVSLFDEENRYLCTIYDIVTYDELQYSYSVDLKLSTTDFRFLLLGKIYYDKHHLFIIYDLFRKELTAKKVQFQVDANEVGLCYRLISPTVLEISYEQQKAEVEFKSAAAKALKVFDFYELDSFRDIHMLGILSINGVKYYLHNKLNGVYLTRANAIKASGYISKLKARFFGRHLYIYGRSTHYAYQASEKYEHLYWGDLKAPLAKFIRPLKIRFFRRYGYFKIPIGLLRPENAEGVKFYLGDENIPLHLLKLKTGKQKKKTVALKRTTDRAYLIHASKWGTLSASVSDEPKNYTWKKRFLSRINAVKSSKTMTGVFRQLFSLVGRLPKKEKLVVFESFHAKQFSDSPRAIYEYMKENCSGYTLLWSIEKQAENLFQQQEVPYIRRFTIRWFLTFPRAKYWVNNVRLPGWMPKPRDTVFIQTWHGTPLKKLGIDIGEIHMPGTNTNTYKRNFVNDAAKWDYLISPNPYSTEIFTRAFHFHGTVVESGYPRNDLLSNYSETLVSSLKKNLGIPEEKKVMLYAPTWRDNEFYEKGKYKFEFQFDLEKWKKLYGNDWVLLSRMHYLVAENFDFSAHEGTVYDVSAYPDIRDLYIISDLLITDYSSVFFDYAILNRPIIFFMYDLENYRDQLRGFYFDIEEEAPGPIVQTEEELFQAINRLAESNIQLDSKFSAFKNKFSSLEDGRAAERAVKAFLNDGLKDERGK